MGSGGQTISKRRHIYLVVTFELLMERAIERRVKSSHVLLYYSRIDLYFT